MNTYSLLPLVTSLLLIVMGIFVYWKNRKNDLNQIFFSLCFTSSIWLFFYSIAYSSQDKQTAFFWFRMGYCGVVFIAVTVFHYTVQLLNIKNLKNFAFANYLIGGICCVLIWSSTLLVKGVYKYFWGYYPAAGHFHPFFLVFFIGLISLSFTLLAYSLLFQKKEIISFIPKITHAITRGQVKYFFLAIFIYNLASVDFFPNYGIEIYPFGYIPTFIFILIIGYTIIKYRLMDIRIFITRATIFIFVYTFVLGLPLWLGFATSQWLWAVLLVGILSTIGPFGYSHLRQQVENVIFRERQRLQEYLRSAAKRIAQISDLPSLWQTLIQEAHKAVESEFVELYILSKENKVFVLNQNSILGDTPHNIKQISLDSLLVKNLIRQKRTMLVETSFGLNLPLETIAVPFFAEGELFGFLLLGPKPKKALLYNEVDFVTFDIFSSQSSLAIENAKHLQELKYSQLELLRQENLKFVQVLVKGLAHEILNPLTPLMHRVEDLEGDSLLKLYDIYEKNIQKLAEEDSLKFKESLLSLRESTKSLKNNAQHIHLIIDTLNKMQKGDETTIGPLDLKSFFKDVVPLLSLEVEPHLQEGITVNQDIANNIPPIKGNPTLLKQIFINLYKNACAAMRNSAVKIINISCKLNAENQKEALIEFSDTGPGISSDTLTKIFTHGFTTKGTKGSGIGLSQCKAIIEKFGGTINIESGQNQGARLIIKLPIW